MEQSRIEEAYGIFYESRKDRINHEDGSIEMSPFENSDYHLLQGLDFEIIKSFGGGNGPFTGIPKELLPVSETGTMRPKITYIEATKYETYGTTYAEAMKARKSMLYKTVKSKTE